MKTVIIGNGQWGQALTSLLRDKSHDIVIWDTKSKVESADVYIICLPLQVTRELLLIAQIENSEQIIVINGSKGIEKDTHKLPSEIIREVIGDRIDYFYLAGPSFASEVMAEMPTMVNIGHKDSINKELVKDMFETDHFKVKLTDKIESLELSGALKNVYAIASGLSDGLGYKYNTRARLVCMAMEELSNIIHIDQSATVGIIGDLILTCNSTESRNYRFGQMLASHKIKKILKEINQTVEGYQTLDSVKKYKMPLLDFVQEVVKADDPKTIRDKFRSFLAKNS